MRSETEKGLVTTVRSETISQGPSRYQGSIRGAGQPFRDTPAFRQPARGDLRDLFSRAVWSGRATDRFEAYVIDPHFADIGLGHDPKVEGYCRSLRLGTDDPLYFHPAADGLQNLLEAAVRKNAPGGRRILVLGQPSPAFPLSSRGNQILEPQAHLGAITNRALRVAIVLVSRNVGFEMEAVGRGDEMASIATIVGGLGPGVLWLCQIMFAIERDLVAKTGRSQGEHHGPYTQEWIVIAIEN